MSTLISSTTNSSATNSATNASAITISSPNQQQQQDQSKRYSLVKWLENSQFDSKNEYLGRLTSVPHSNIIDFDAEDLKAGMEISVFRNGEIWRAQIIIPKTSSNTIDLPPSSHKVSKIRTKAMGTTKIGDLGDEQLLVNLATTTTTPQNTSTSGSNSINTAPQINCLDGNNNKTFADLNDFEDVTSLFAALPNTNNNASNNNHASAAAAASTALSTPQTLLLLTTTNQLQPIIGTATNVVNGGGKLTNSSATGTTTANLILAATASNNTVTSPNSNIINNSNANSNNNNNIVSSSSSASNKEWQFLQTAINEAGLTDLYQAYSSEMTSTSGNNTAVAVTSSSSSSSNNKPTTNGQTNSSSNNSHYKYTVSDMNIETILQMQCELLDQQKELKQIENATLNQLRNLHTNISTLAKKFDVFESFVAHRAKIDGSTTFNNQAKLNNSHHNLGILSSNISPINSNSNKNKRPQRPRKSPSSNNHHNNSNHQQQQGGGGACGTLFSSASSLTESIDAAVASVFNAVGVVTFETAPTTTVITTNTATTLENTNHHNNINNSNSNNNNNNNCNNTTNNSGNSVVVQYHQLNGSPLKTTTLKLTDNPSDLNGSSTGEDCCDENYDAENNTNSTNNNGEERIQCIQNQFALNRFLREAVKERLGADFLVTHAVSDIPAEIMKQIKSEAFEKYMPNDTRPMKAWCLAMASLRSFKRDLIRQKAKQAAAESTAASANNATTTTNNNNNNNNSSNLNDDSANDDKFLAPLLAQLAAADDHTSSTEAVKNEETTYQQVADIITEHTTVTVSLEPININLTSSLSSVNTTGNVKRSATDPLSNSPQKKRK